MKNTIVREEISVKILNQIKGKIIPDVKKIFLKLFIVHCLVALVTLSVCPQLGVSTFKTGLNIIHTMSFLGQYTCELVCGFFFTSTSILVSLIFLSRDEVRYLSYKKFYLASIFVLISIGGLLMFNSALFVELSLLWLIGTMAGVLFTIELGSFIFRHLILK